MEPRPPPKVHTPEVLPPGSGGIAPDTLPAPGAARRPNAGSLHDAGAGITTKRKVLALLVAAASDALSLAAQFAPPIQWTIDVVTALLLFRILGFRWPLLPVFVMEAIPGLATFPTWILATSVIAGTTPTRKA